MTVSIDVMASKHNNKNEDTIGIQFLHFVDSVDKRTQKQAISKHLMPVFLCSHNAFMAGCTPGRVVEAEGRSTVAGRKFRAF